MTKNVNGKIFALKRPNRLTKARQKFGLTNRRNVLWSWYEPRNFGDWIGPYLFWKITGKRPLFHRPSPIEGRIPDQATTVASAGSILRHIAVPDKVRVWGSGIISMNDTFQRAMLYLTYPPETPINRGQGENTCRSCPTKSSTTNKPPTIT